MMSQPASFPSSDQFRDAPPPTPSLTPDVPSRPRSGPASIRGSVARIRETLGGDSAVEPPTAPKWSIHGAFAKLLSFLKRITSFPMLVSEAIYFGEDGRYDAAGNLKPEDETPKQGLSPEETEILVNFDPSTKGLFEAVIKYRKESKNAKEDTTKNIDLKEFKEWSALGDQILDRYKVIFNIFDVSGNGFVDFDEFSTILEEFGDVAPPETRKLYFDTMADSLGHLDFLAFLRLVYRLTVRTPDDAGAQELAQTMRTIDRNISRLRSLDVVQQLQAGLF